MSMIDKKVAILVEDLYEDLELWYPYYRLREEGAEVHLVGSGRLPTHTSRYGYPASEQLTSLPSSSPVVTHPISCGANQRWWTSCERWIAPVSQWLRFVMLVGCWYRRTSCVVAVPHASSRSRMIWLRRGLSMWMSLRWWMAIS